MSEQFENTDIDDALSASLRVLSAVKNADAYDELASAIAIRYAQRSDFNRAVEIADTINDPFSMDSSIAEIAVLLSVAGQEIDAFELIESIEDPSHQATAKSQIAIVHATAGDFDRAIAIAMGMDDNSATLVDIAFQLSDKGLHDRALEIIGMLDFPLGVTWVLMRVAKDYHIAGREEEALELFSQALEETEAIDPPNDRAGALAELALKFREVGREEDSVDAMAQAMEIAAEAGDEFKDSALSQIASGQAHLKQYDVAVSIAEKIDGIYIAASTLVDLASIEHEDEERHDEAVLLLSDAFDLIVEDEPQTQRDESQHNYLLSRIALSSAYFGNADKALKAAKSIYALDRQTKTISDVALRFSESEDFENALTFGRLIDDKAYRAAVIIRIGRAICAAGLREQGIEVLAEASRLNDALETSLESVQTSASLAIAYFEAEQNDRVVTLITQAMQSTKLITDPDTKTTALISIADACSATKHEIDAESKDMLWEISAV